MRITNKMMANNYLRDMGTNLNNMQNLNNQLSSGKEIRRPSDNPYKVARSMQLNTDINTNKQYNENIKDTTNWLDTTDESLGQLTNVVQRVRELLVSSGNAAYGSSERSAISDEINERISEFSQILNSNFDGKYIFGGTKTTSKPLEVTKNAVTGANELSLIDKEGNKLDLASTDVNVVNQLDMLGTKLKTEVSQGVGIEYNVNVLDVLKFSDSEGTETDVMSLLKDVTKNLVSSDKTDNLKLTNENLKSIDNMITNLLKIRAEVGAKQNRMESAQTKNEDENYNMTDILSQTEDIDFTSKTIEFSMANTVYQASLQVSGQILPKTLMDYL
jgi:flagellar hook-associated protein 3 FlgL